MLTVCVFVSTLTIINWNAIKVAMRKMTRRSMLPFARHYYLSDMRKSCDAPFPSIPAFPSLRDLTIFQEKRTITAYRAEVCLIA